MLRKSVISWRRLVRCSNMYGIDLNHNPDSLPRQINSSRQIFLSPIRSCRQLCLLPGFRIMPERGSPYLPAASWNQRVDEKTALDPTAATTCGQDLESKRVTSRFSPGCIV